MDNAHLASEFTVEGGNCGCTWEKWAQLIKEWEANGVIVTGRTSYCKGKTGIEKTCKYFYVDVEFEVDISTYQLFY
jgi:hypothetical protein